MKHAHVDHMKDQKPVHIPPKLQAQSDVARLLKLLSPLLPASDKIEELESVAQQAEELGSLPERFADAFAARGWLISESTSLETARNALERAEAGKLDEAEEILARDFEGDQLGNAAIWLGATPAFRDRRAQIQEALLLTQEKRYIASIPLLFVIADGAAQDYFGRSLFREGIDITELDALAGGSNGLSALVKEVCRTRQALNTEAISFPYRNGIIHGRELGYANSLVSAKSWSLLMNLADVIRAKENAKANKGESRTLTESIESYKATLEQTARIDAWSARPTSTPNISITSPEAQLLEEGTPEHVLAKFLRAWRANNFGEMGRITNYLDGRPVNKRAGDIRGLMQGFALRDGALLQVKDATAAITDIECALRFTANSHENEEIFSFRVLYVDAKADLCPRGDPKGRWEVMPSYQGWVMQKKRSSD